jgi:hypothetical protein
MLRDIATGLMIVLAIGDQIPEAHAQDPAARCVSVEKRQTTIVSAQGRGFDIEIFSEVETAAFLRAFNALLPKSNFIATTMFAAVGADRAFVFFESGNDICTTPSPLYRAGYKRLVTRSRGNGA